MKSIIGIMQQKLFSWNIIRIILNNGNKRTTVIYIFIVHESHKIYKTSKQSRILSTLKNQDYEFFAMKTSLENGNSEKHSKSLGHAILHDFYLFINLSKKTEKAKL